MCICARILNLQYHSLTIASSTVPTSLFEITATTVYLVKALVMHSTNFFALSTVIMGLNRSAWILKLGLSGIGSGLNGMGFSVDDFLVGNVGRILYGVVRPGTRKVRNMMR